LFNYASLTIYLTARFSTIEAPYGIDMIIEFHKQISLVACILIIIHPAILMFTYSSNLQLLNPLTAPFRALMGLTSLFSLLIIVVISIFRKELNIGYEIWKTLHGILAMLQNNHPVELSTNSMIDQRLEYLHNNQVEAGFVAGAHFYLYSCAIDYSGRKDLLEIIHAS
jgi:predicted ferric reductase